MNYRDAPYVTPGADYSTYRDAYRYGWESRAPGAMTGTTLRTTWSAGGRRPRRPRRLGWSEAKEAVRDGWHHVERAMPGDADRDGR